MTEEMSAYCHADGKGPCVAKCCPIESCARPTRCPPTHQVCEWPEKRSEEIETERTTARGLRSSWVTDGTAIRGWTIASIKGDHIASDIPTEELANHIVNHHNMVVQEWHSLQRE
jgi:hypothetical protein